MLKFNEMFKLEEFKESNLNTSHVKVQHMLQIN